MNLRRWLLWTLVTLAARTVVVGQVWMTYRVFTSRFPGGNDFYPRWVGGCVLLNEGLSPYSETVTLRAQQGLFGRPACPGEDQATFLYPLYSLLFFWPLCFTDNYPLVRAVWMWGLLAGLTAAAALWIAGDRLAPPPSVVGVDAGVDGALVSRFSRGDIGPVYRVRPAGSGSCLVGDAAGA